MLIASENRSIKFLRRFHAGRVLLLRVRDENRAACLGDESGQVPVASNTQAVTSVLCSLVEWEYKGWVKLIRARQAVGREVHMAFREEFCTCESRIGSVCTSRPQPPNLDIIEKRARPSVPRTAKNPWRSP